MESPESHVESPIIEMARSKKKEASKDQARVSYESRFNKAYALACASLAEYNKSLENGDFEDRDDEEVGSGEKRKETMQEKISFQTTKAERMKVILESGDYVPLIQEEIEATYVYSDTKTGKVERREDIILNIEENLQSFLELYEDTGIDTPQDFEEEIRDIWSRNREEIQKAIEEKGFDSMVLVPANLGIEELSQKLKVENGYYDYIKSSSRVQDLNGIPLSSTGTDKHRIILVHSTQNLVDHPELKSTLGVKAQDVNIEESLSLEDYIIFQRQYFKVTGKHLDSDSNVTWTPRTKSGTRFVCSRWDSGDGGLDVGALDADYSRSILGCRSSRYFS